MCIMYNRLFVFFNDEKKILADKNKMQIYKYAFQQMTYKLK